jgi:hypothetical protein
VRDEEILGTIEQLVDEEHELRGGGEGVDTERLRRLEVTLDQCWDLLRQRRARREYGENPDEAQVRPPSTVEGYRQ